VPSGDVVPLLFVDVVVVVVLPVVVVDPVHVPYAIWQLVPQYADVVPLDEVSQFQMAAFRGNHQ
jgi:hypothetical protein